MTWHPDTPPEYRNQIVTGDAHELAKAIPDGSVDLILCDPVYWEINDYRWVAELGRRVLTIGGNLVVQIGQEFMPDCFLAMKDALEFVWPLVDRLDHANARIWSKRIFAAYKPWLWYSNGRRSGRWMRDLISNNGISKDFHDWGDGTGFIETIIVRLTDPESVILDPFTGGGTVPAVCKMLGRNYIAFEIEPDTAARARQRVSDTQPPMTGFVEAYQAAMFEETE